MAKYEIKDGVGIIPEGTTCIEDYAFRDCKELKSIVIPDSVMAIGTRAFEDCI
ncbi:MAG: leucine-rich repeat protein [Bacteroidaceae bacterium]|nr:leucine-rich repeat protein [Bacteroidaceae bacterium]